MSTDPAKRLAAELYQNHFTDLSKIESQIRLLLTSDAPRLTEISTYLLDLGGKRIRPLLAVIISRLFQTDIDNAQLVKAAAGIELIHMATLLHDDIIDKSEVRRTKTSAFKKYGLADTLLTGDYLLVRAFGLCATLDRYIVTSTEQACAELTEGEILEGTLTCEASEQSYKIVAAKKTASLFSLAAGVGAHCASQSRAVVQSMEKFGLEAGIGFQIIDDILDVTADEQLLGKPIGLDLKQKTPSIVNILWYNSGEKSAKEYFDSDTADYKEALELLKTSPVLDVARSMASNRIKTATEILESTSEELSEDIKSQLKDLLSFTLKRAL